MTIQHIVIRRYAADPPQPLLQVHRSSSHRFAEVAGGTTAECAAVCCCCPFALINLLVLAVYGVPAGLYRRAVRKKRRRRVLKDVSGGVSGRLQSGCYAAELLIHPAVIYGGAGVVMGLPAEDGGDAAEMEEEMWEKLYGTGFWRSASQRVD